MNKCVKWISFLIFVVIFSEVAQAREWLELYNNSRTTAMGGTQVALTSDETSVFRNAASLGSFRGVYASVFDPEIEFSQNQENQYLTTMTDVAKVKDFVVANPEKFYRGKLQMTPTISARYFSFGMMYRNEISAVMSSDATTMDTQYYSDLGAFAAFNISLWEGRIKLGVTAKMINRIEVNNDSLDPNGSMDMGTIASEGTGTGADAALSLQAPVKFLPTLAVVARDLGDMKFDTTHGMRLSTTNRPAIAKQSVDIGLSFAPIYSRDFRGLIAFEYKDATNSREEDFQAKRAHAGLELVWRDVFYVRAGSNQTYWTAGFEISSERLSWQVSTYGEEVGTVTAPREDRRFSTRFGIRF